MKPINAQDGKLFPKLNLLKKLQLIFQRLSKNNNIQID